MSFLAWLRAWDISVKAGHACAMLTPATGATSSVKRTCSRSSTAFHLRHRASHKQRSEQVLVGTDVRTQFMQRCRQKHSVRSWSLANDMAFGQGCGTHESCSLTAALHSANAAFRAALL